MSLSFAGVAQPISRVIAQLTAALIKLPRSVKAPELIGASRSALQGPGLSDLTVERSFGPSARSPNGEKISVQEMYIVPNILRA